jgi:hypothetical protein
VSYSLFKLGLWVGGSVQMVEQRLASAKLLSSNSRTAPKNPNPQIKLGL